MDAVTIKEFKALEHRSIAHVDAVGDAVELGIPESEGWRFVISATLNEQSRPTLHARWEPGLRPPLHTVIRRMIVPRRRRCREALVYRTHNPMEAS
jgi:hypothetical protein